MLTLQETSGRNTFDKNEKFLRTVLKPWEHDADLKAFIPLVNELFVEEVQDNVALHIDDMASKVFAYETMVYAKIASRWEQEGVAFEADQRVEDPAPPDSPQSDSAPMTAAEQLDLPVKDIDGREYRACAKCFVMSEELVWHPEYLCPVEIKFKAKSAGPSRAELQPQRKAMLGEAKQYFVCHTCGMP